MTTLSEADKEPATQLAGGDPQRMPSLGNAVKDARATRELMFTIRHFHLGDPAAGTQLETPGEDFLPALLDPYRDTSRLRYNYPLLLFPLGGNRIVNKVRELVQPLSEWLQQATAEFAPDKDAARILKDHLPWIEINVRQLLRQREGPMDAGATLAESARALQTHLQLADTDRERLELGFSQLLESIPQGAQLLGYGRYPALHLMIHAVRGQALARRAQFRDAVEECIQGLNSLLQVEWGKSDEAIEPRMARDSIGPGGALFDPAALSAVMDHSKGTRQMPAGRRERIERALLVLNAWHSDAVLVRFVHIGTLNSRWLREVNYCEEITDADPCASAMELFDREAERLTEVFSAVRIARLEIQGIYDPILHDPWFANFDWEAFSSEELLLVPSIIALGSADQVAGEGLRSLSRLLSSGRPVQILIRVQPHNNPGAGPDEDPLRSYRTELGYLGISHRQAVVCQTSAARHEHLLRSFFAALEATRTSLHLVNTGLREPSGLVPLNAWLVAGAAIESRAHPFFRINPQAGDSAASRMNFIENPQPDLDWPLQSFRYQDENGSTVDSELAFTFGDYALLIDRLRNHFRIVPPGCDSDALLPLQEYLAMGKEEAYQRVPFIWAVDGNTILYRLVVSRELAMACRDRRNYWRALQEMAGIRNRYVEQAIRETRASEQQLATEARARLQEEHAEELEQVRNQAAGEAMQHLADSLLGMDPAAAESGWTSVNRATRSAEDNAAPAAESETQEEPEASVEAEDTIAFDDPWIDTPLCTSCNDCLEINSQLFVYDEEKQALLGDLSSASYAELVAAAEICPARCIHPGKPWDPAEPDLDTLIERAAPFNQ
jgi:ferredoxin